MLLHKRKEGLHRFLIQTVDAFLTVLGKTHESALLKASQVVRSEALLQVEFLGNGGHSVRLLLEEMDDAPPRPVAERLEEDFMWLARWSEHMT